MLATSNNLHLISKLKYNAALTFKYTGEQPKRGRKRLYGEKVDAHNIPQTYWKETITTDDTRSEIYNFEAYSQHTFGQQILNIVVCKTIRLSDNKVAINIWFSSDVDLAYNLLLDYYSLRFQIEFDFRDAKQHFGFSDFKNYKEQKVTNFANLSFTMCLVAKIQLAEFRTKLLTISQKSERVTRSHPFTINCGLLFKSFWYRSFLYNIALRFALRVEYHKIYSAIELPTSFAIFAAIYLVFGRRVRFCPKRFRECGWRQFLF